jgi:hypothetical protein
VTSVVPRVVKVRDIESLVIWNWRGRARLHGAGLRLVWPVVMSSELVDLRWRSTLTYVQTLTTADGHSVSARALLIWRPEDVLLMIQKSADYGDRTAEVTQSCVQSVLSRLTIGDLRGDVANKHLVTRTSRAMGVIGIEVHSCRLVELVSSPALRLINDAAGSE